MEFAFLVVIGEIDGRGNKEIKYDNAVSGATRFAAMLPRAIHDLNAVPSAN
jgi:hypothetical protein